MSGTLLTAEGSLIVPCATCGGRNRVRPERLLASPRCGRCSAVLPPPDEPLEAGGPALEALVRTSPLPVVADFWAEWCGPCKSFAPTFARYAREAAGRVLAVKVDTQTQRAAASRYQVQAIPTLIVFKGGTVAARSSGALPLAQLDQLVESA